MSRVARASPRNNPIALTRISVTFELGRISNDNDSPCPRARDFRTIPDGHHRRARVPRSKPNRLVNADRRGRTKGENSTHVALRVSTIAGKMEKPARGADRRRNDSRAISCSFDPSIGDDSSRSRPSHCSDQHSNSIVFEAVLIVFTLSLYLSSIPFDVNTMLNEY